MRGRGNVVANLQGGPLLPPLGICPPPTVHQGWSMSLRAESRSDGIVLPKLGHRRCCGSLLDSPLASSLDHLLWEKPAAIR